MGVKSYVKNLKKSSKDILLDWLKETRLFTVINGEIMSIKQAKEINKGKAVPDINSIKNLSKKEIKSFISKYTDGRDEDFTEAVKNSFKNTVHSIKTGDLNHFNKTSIDAMDDFFEDDDIKALFADLDDDNFGESYINEGGYMKSIFEVKNENIKKLRLTCTKEGLDITGPIDELNNRLITAKDDILDLDDSITKNLNEDDIITVNLTNDRIDKEKANIMSLINTVLHADSLEAKYKNAFADAIIALYSIKANYNHYHDCHENINGDKEALVKDLQDMGSKDVVEIVEPALNSIEIVANSDKDDLVFKPEASVEDVMAAGEELSAVAEVGGILGLITAVIAVPLNLAVAKNNLDLEKKYGSNFIFKQPMIASSDLSKELVSKYAKALEVKAAVEVKAILEGTLAVTDGGSIISRATKTGYFTPMTLKQTAAFAQDKDIDYNKLLSVFSESDRKYFNVPRAEDINLSRGAMSLFNKNLEAYDTFNNIKVMSGSGEDAQFLSTSRNAHPTYIEVQITYREPKDLTSLAQDTKLKKTTIGLHVIPRIISSVDILKTLDTLGDFEEVKVLPEERVSIKKLKNVLNFWKKEGTPAEKSLLTSKTVFGGIVDKIEKIKTPLFHLVISYNDYMELKPKLDLMDGTTYDKVFNKLPLISISIINEDSDVVYYSEGSRMAYSRHDVDDFIDSVSKYEQDLKTLIKYDRHQ